MNLLIAGISHRTSPIHIRERFFLRNAEREWLLSELRSDVRILEAVVISTCNRTEVYARTLSTAGPEVLLEKLFRVKKITDGDRFSPHFYHFREDGVIRHFLEVITGLDSIVLGEKQILGQVKSAVEMSRRMRMMNKTFHVLTNIGIRAGKKARHETEIGCGGASVSWAAVTLARDILDGLSGKSALIIGAGKMGEMAIRQLRQSGMKKIYLMNRTLERAREIARPYGGIPVGFWDLAEILPKTDLCICSAGAPHYLLEKEAVEAAAQKERRERLFIDISIPRNIDPEVTQVPGTKLLTVDDLGNLVEENIQRRAGAVGSVRKIIEEKTAAFYHKMDKIRDHEIRQKSAGENCHVAH